MRSGAVAVQVSGNGPIPPARLSPRVGDVLETQTAEVAQQPASDRAAPQEDVRPPVAVQVDDVDASAY